MEKIPYLLFGAVFSLDYLALRLNVIPRGATWIPEALAAIALLMVLLKLAVDRRIDLSPKYVVLGGSFIALAAVGIIINSVQPGTIFAGVRNYFKFVPFFLLPIAFCYSAQHTQRFLRVLVVLAVSQLPLAVYQRLFQFKGVLTGDVIAGTLVISSVLSMFLIASIAVLVAYYLKGYIRSGRFLVLLALLFLPATLNETKSTLVLFPLALFLPILLLPEGRAKWRYIVLSGVATLIAMVVFFAIYDHFMMPRKNEGLVEFIGSKDRIVHYLYGGAAAANSAEIDGRERPLGLGYSLPEERVERIDSVVLPLRVLSADPVKLLVGLGVGNVSDSYVAALKGHYVHYLELGAQRSTLSQLLWETGVIGALLAVMFLVCVFRDAMFMRRDDGVNGALALGWTAVTAIALVALPYKNLLLFNVLGYLFAFFAGHVAGMRVRVEREQRARRPESGMEGGPSAPTLPYGRLSGSGAL